MEDELLKLRFKYGSSDALCRIYEKYVDHLLTVAIALLNNVSDAEDVVHDVFVSFAKSTSKFKLNGSLKCYLEICVANRARDSLRAKQKRPAIGLDGISEISSDSNAPNIQVLYNEEKLEQLNHMLAALPYEQRETVVLHLQGELKFKQIAELQNISINTVQSRYRYGIDKLRLLADSEVKNGTHKEHRKADKGASL